uniref:Uncharacterized protein n=1 Tax=Anguilla anguilla TaxID=7936 RepID=A0A0E9VZX9_ANGAN
MHPVVTKRSLCTNDNSKALHCQYIQN